MKETFICILVIFFACSPSGGWKHYVTSPENRETNGNTDVPKLSNSTSYCYHFTWMGGHFNNRTFKNIMNKTCSQYFKDKKTLCINPMVATYTGGEPDLGYILMNHPTAATCRLSQEQVCAKYTVFYNGIVSYQTRYCTQINIDFEGPMRTGCVQEFKGSEVVEVCACKSQPGPDGICNSSFRPSAILSLVILIIYRIFIGFS